MSALRPFSVEWADALKASITGDPHYRAVARGWTRPIALVLTAVARRRVTLTGALMTLLVHARAAQAMVACAQKLPTRFPDDEIGEPRQP